MFSKASELILISKEKKTLNIFTLFDNKKISRRLWKIATDSMTQGIAEFLVYDILKLL